MSKTAKIEARVRPANLERYRQAAAILQLEEMSDFVRRACDHLAFEVLDADTDKPVASFASKPVAQQVPAGGRVPLSDGRRVRR